MTLSRFSLINKINNCYYLNFVAQMGASTFMICLSAFMAIMAKDQPMVALKFQVFMFSVFQQLFYWCWTGNMTYYTVRVAKGLQMFTLFSQSYRPN